MKPTPFIVFHDSAYHRALTLTAVCLLSVQLAGCAAVAVGGIAATASVAHDRRTTGTFIEDQSIELKTTKALFSNKELKSQVHINATSYNNIVLVSGEAPTEQLRNEVINIVRNIEKVRHVFDEISIAAPSSFMSRSSDSLITAKVKTKLLSIKNFDGTRVKVVTENGVVYLMGLLTQEETDAITGVARKVGGVQKIVKLFEVRGD